MTQQSKKKSKQPRKPTKKERVKKPLLHAVRGDYSMPEKIKLLFDLSKLLRTTAGSWCNIEVLVDAYFVNCLNWEDTGKDYLERLSMGLLKFSKSNFETPKIRSYAAGVAEFFGDEAIIKKCNRYYHLKAAQAEAAREAALARLQGDTTGAILSRVGAKKLGKRTIDELFEEEEDDEEDEEDDEDDDGEEVGDDGEEEEEVEEIELIHGELENAFVYNENEPSSFVVKRKRNSYDIHAPSQKHIISPKKPILQTQDRRIIDEHFDLRLSSDLLVKCGTDLDKQYISHVRNMKTNSALRQVLGDDYQKFISELFDVIMPDYPRQIFNIDHAPNVFIDFMKLSYTDLCTCWNDPQDYNDAGERTLFAEVFVQQFKLFGKITKHLKFKWIEKKQVNADHGWLVKKDFRKKDVQLKLLDGIGIMKKKNVNLIMLESSGVGENIVEHTLEDTVKNLKHATDSLTNILCDYKDCSINTVKKVEVLTGHVINEKLTLIKYKIGESLSKWSALEVRSCSVPLCWEKRKESIKLFELFAYIYLTIIEQNKVYNDLSDEKLGLLVVEEEDMLCNSYFMKK